MFHSKPFYTFKKSQDLLHFYHLLLRSKIKTFHLFSGE